MTRRDHRQLPKQPPAGDEREPAGKPWLSVRPGKIERARKLAQGNVNPQLIVADLLRRLAEAGP